MGWYHYQAAEDGNPDPSQPIECPDGTCPSKKEACEGTCESKGETVAPIEKPPAEPVDKPYYPDAPIYHLCQATLWREAIRFREPYFPPTFWADGKFTRASCEAEGLPDTANHYYKHIKGDWLCLELDHLKLKEMGVVMVAQRAPESTEEDPVECLKVYSGIPVTVPGIVRKVYAMKRDLDGTFRGMMVTNLVKTSAIPTPKPAAPQKAEQPKSTATSKDESKEKKKGLRLWGRKART